MICLLLIFKEAAHSETVLLDNTYNELQQLSLKQDELLRQALRCIENKLYRAAHILCWAALMDFLEAVLASDNFKKLRKNSTKLEF